MIKVWDKVWLTVVFFSNIKNILVYSAARLWEQVLWKVQEYLSYVYTIVFLFLIPYEVTCSNISPVFLSFVKVCLWIDRCSVWSPVGVWVQWSSTLSSCWHLCAQYLQEFFVSGVTSDAQTLLICSTYGIYARMSFASISSLNVGFPSTSHIVFSDA